MTKRKEKKKKKDRQNRQNKKPKSALADTQIAGAFYTKKQNKTAHQYPKCPATAIYCPLCFLALQKNYKITAFSYSQWTRWWPKNKIEKRGKR